MALHKIISSAVLVFVLILAIRVEFSTCHVLKGSVACLDCNRHYDLSDIKVAVKCGQAKNLAVTNYTAEDGTFETELPSDPTSLNCLARILGGPTQLYVSRKNMQVSTTIKSVDYSYTIFSTPLKFYTSCPLSKSDAKCGAHNAVKTVDLPLPPEWGLAPSSYYAPFLPIIGIP